MQKVRGHPEGLPLFVGTRFQVLFHSPLGVLFTFPSRYSFTIGHQVVLSLGGWSPQIPAGFHVPHCTQDTDCPTPAFVYGGVTLYAVPSQALPLTFVVPMSVLQPHTNELMWFGLFPVRSPLLRESRLISFPTGT